MVGDGDGAILPETRPALRLRVPRRWRLEKRYGWKGDAKRPGVQEQVWVSYGASLIGGYGYFSFEIIWVRAKVTYSDLMEPMVAAREM